MLLVLCEATKISKYVRTYKEMDNIHFEPFVLESGGVLGEKSTSCLLQNLQFNNPIIETTRICHRILLEI